jgi:phosphinothricin acetyltransferase
MIRIARDEDAAAIQAIYAPHVIEGAATFETVLPGVEAMRERIRARLPQYPWLVWEERGDVLAYAYAGRFRERAAYDWIAETSIYVDAGAQRRGIARRLYTALLDTLRLQGLNQAVGVITVPNPVSVGFHESLGFEPAGTWRQCGYKLGRWWDVGVWQKELQAAANPPPAITPFAVLAQQPAWTALLERSLRTP